MNEIERLNPGLVVRATDRPASRERQAVAITHRRRSAVLADVARRMERGEIETAGRVQLLTTGAHAGLYAVRVVLVNQEPIAARSLAPRWFPRWAAILCAVVLSVSVLLIAAGWFLTALSPASLAGFCLTLLALLGVLLLAGRKPRSNGNVTVISTINVGR